MDEVAATREECTECFREHEVLPVRIRHARGGDWVDSSIRRCANDECWAIRDGSEEDIKVWLKNVYEYKYFGDYELSPEQKQAVREAFARATK